MAEFSWFRAQVLAGFVPLLQLAKGEETKTLLGLSRAVPAGGNGEEFPASWKDPGCPGEAVRTNGTERKDPQGLKRKRVDTFLWRRLKHLSIPYKFQKQVNQPPQEISPPLLQCGLFVPVHERSHAFFFSLIAQNIASRRYKDHEHTSGLYTVRLHTVNTNTSKKTCQQLEKSYKAKCMHMRGK